MNRLKSSFADLELVKRINELEAYIDNNNELKLKINSLKDIQKKMVNAKEFKQFNQYKVYKNEYDLAYNEILEYPFVEEYLELLDEANEILLNVSHIIENKINSKLN